MALYNGANRDVAILCNHQKTVSSAQKEGLQKLQDRLEMLNKQKHVRGCMHAFSLSCVHDFFFRAY